MEKQPSFITYKPASPASPAERLATIAIASGVTDIWLFIHDGVVCSTYLGYQIRPETPCVWVEVGDRGNGPEICMEFYNCDPLPAANHIAKWGLLDLHGTIHL